ncbi:AraC family transcriptional regulator [Pendulispora rubella]|uniref:AraC family transcriptional regulator n=1 Tax=Pendulispora rubella TaxID=2741070 RepID=A0ABZ2KYT0_9BACT
MSSEFHPITAFPFEGVGHTGEFLPCAADAEWCSSRPILNPACMRRVRMSFRHRRIPAVLVAALRHTRIDFASPARRLGLEPGFRELATEVQIEKWLALIAPSLPSEFGLMLGAQVRAESLGLIGLAARFSQNLADALRRLAQLTLLGDELRILRDERETALVIHSGGDVPFARKKADAIAASVLAIAQQLTGSRVAPAMVAFAFPPPDTIRYRDQYRATFGHPVLFDERITVMVFANTDLEKLVIGASPELAETFARHAAEDPIGLRLPDDVVTAVRAALRVHMFESTPLFSELALLMGVSESQLRARCHENEVRYPALVEEVRRERALLLLRHSPTYTNAEIASLVGTTDEPFRIALRRWLGLSPDEARRALRP